VGRARPRLPPPPPPHETGLWGPAEAARGQKQHDPAPNNTGIEPLVPNWPTAGARARRLRPLLIIYIRDKAERATTRDKSVATGSRPASPRPVCLRAGSAHYGLRLARLLASLLLASAGAAKLK
jgi:hypothetical protein